MKFNRIKFSLVLIVVLLFGLNRNSALAQDTITHHSFGSYIPISTSPKYYSSEDSLYQTAYRKRHEEDERRDDLKYDSCQKVANLLNERYSGRNFYYCIYSPWSRCPSSIPVISIHKEEKWNPGSQHKIYFQDELWDGLYFQQTIR